MMMTIRKGCLCAAHPNVKGPGEVVQVGLNENNVPKAQLGTPTLSPEQRLFLVLDEDDLRRRPEKRLVQGTL